MGALRFGDVSGIGICIGALGDGGAAIGIVIGAFAGAFVLAGFSAGAAFLAADGFFAAGLSAGDIFMPGMFIWASAGAAAVLNATANPTTRRNDLTQNPSTGALPAHAGGAILRGSAIAGLAGAGVTAAALARFASAACLAVFFLGHFHFLFFVAQQRANHHITPVPWYGIKRFLR